MHSTLHATQAGAVLQRKQPALSRPRACRHIRGACLWILRHTGLWLCLLPCLAMAQTNEELFREYQFNFNLPGARANAMGGAFIGVADDATSSFSNPAGLAFLTETAVTLEYRRRDIEARTGDIEGNFNTQFEQFSTSLDGVAFFSVNFRIKAWYFGVFQYDYLNERQGRIFQSRSLADGVQRREVREIMLDLKGVTRGVGIARRLGNIKLGFTINNFNLRGLTDYSRFGIVTSGLDEPQTGLFTSAIDDQDQAWGYNLGFLHEPGTRFSWGAVWRDNPRLRLQEDVLEEVNEQPVTIVEVTVPFVVPDVFGLGMRYKLRPGFHALLDWQRIFYSQIIKDGFVIVESAGSETKDNYEIKDSDDFHFGLELLLGQSENVWAVRAGYWRNPLHAVTYKGQDAATQDRFAGTGLTDENQYTLGVGWVFRNRLEIDISANYWDVGSEVTTSFIWRKK